MERPLNAHLHITVVRNGIGRGFLHTDEAVFDEEVINQNTVPC